MELLPLCPTQACLSFVLPNHRYCPACERAVLRLTRPQVPQVPQVEEEPQLEEQPLQASA